jgi:hypothetical protein
MAMTVIDLLEAVNVDHEDGQGTAGIYGGQGLFALGRPQFGLARL